MGGSLISNGEICHDSRFIFFQDVRVGLRVLFKDKAFCFLAVLVLGLGIGGATTQFTVVNAVALRGFFISPPGATGDHWVDRSESDRSKTTTSGSA